jgi:hypothetical protein
VGTNSDKKVYLSNLIYNYELHIIIDSNDPQISKLNSFAVAVKATIAAVMGASLFSQAAMYNISYFKFL